MPLPRRPPCPRRTPRPLSTPLSTSFPPPSPPATRVKSRAERIGRNPKTKESIKIPASKVPVFKPGKALKDAVAK